jgi:mannose-1-phosphate guanylyltransferase
VRAVVLVGGFGTRLRPLTLETPKQMLPIVGVTMFERVVARLGACGVDEAVVSLGFRPDRFIDAFPDGTCAGVALHYATEPEPLDTAGAIRFAALHARIDDTFIVVNGDVLTDLDYGWLVDEHRRLGAEATIHLIAVDDPSRFGVVATDDSGRVLSFVEKPAPGTEPSNLINAGTYVLEPSVIDRIPDGRKVSVEREIFPELAAAGTLFAVSTSDYWIDAGTPAAYLQANLDLVDGSRSDETAVDATADIAPSAKVTRSVVGAGAVIETDAIVEDSMVMAGAHVGAGSTVSGSIVGRGATVGAGCSVTAGSVVGHDSVVDPGVELVGAIAPDPSTWQ